MSSQPRKHPKTQKVPEPQKQPEATESIPPRGRPREKTQKMPCFVSMEQCATIAKIPMLVIKQAKAEGCPAFLSNRIYLAPFLEWYFQQVQKGNSGTVDGGEEPDTWRQEWEMWKARREKLRFQNDSEALIDRASVNSGAQKVMSLIFSTLDRVFCNELPPVTEGLTARDVGLKNGAAIEQLKNLLRNEIGEMAEEKGDMKEIESESSE